MTGLYLRPLGLLRYQFDQTILPLSNTGLGFTVAEIIERKSNDVARRIVTVNELKILAKSNHAVEQQLRCITTPRTSWVGLSLDQPRIMGILNVTPDSFSDGGLYDNLDAASQRAEQMMAEGADIIDVGGESTRPKAKIPTEQEELQRVIPVIERIGKKAILSVDTRRATIMEQAIKTGAAIINDVSALTHDPEALAFVAKNNLPVVLMHMQGTPETMQDSPHYHHAALDVFDYLQQRIVACEQAGLPRDNIVIDPGIGFGKNLEHNLTILSHLSMFHALGCGILIGVSRKAFLGKIMQGNDPAKRLAGSISAALHAVQNGVQIIRAHDVADTKQALQIWMKL